MSLFFAVSLSELPEDQQNQQLTTKIFLTVGSEMTFLKKCSQIISTARVDQGSLTEFEQWAALPGVCLGGTSSPA